MKLRRLLPTKLKTDHRTGLTGQLEGVPDAMRPMKVVVAMPHVVGRISAESLYFRGIEGPWPSEAKDQIDSGSAFFAVVRDYFGNSEPIVIDHDSTGRDDVAGSW